MNIENIAALTEQMKALGFETPGLALLKRICFKPDLFTLTERIEQDGEVIQFHVVFERTANQDSYQLRYYDAILQKEHFAVNTVINGCTISDIESMMAAVNWKNAFDFNEEKQWMIADKTSWEKELKVEAIIEALQQLEATDEGKLVASALKVRHWAGTAYQELYGPIPAVKNKTDVSQRFYLANGQAGISTNEAIRFLQNRSLDKQMQEKKKMPASADTENAADGKASSGNGLLMKKRLHKTKGRKKIN